MGTSVPRTYSISCYAQRNVAVRGCALLSDARAVSMHWFIRVSMFSISSACGGPDAHLMHTVRAARGHACRAETRLRFVPTATRRRSWWLRAAGGPGDQK